MLTSLKTRHLATLLMGVLLMMFSYNPAGAEDLTERVVKLSHCQGGLTAISEYHPSERVRASFKDHAASLEFVGPLYSELGELDEQIYKDATAAGYRDVADVINAGDEDAFKRFLDPCIAVLQNLSFYELETISVSHMLALIGVGEPAEPRQFLLDNPDSVFAPILRKKLEELK